MENFKRYSPVSLAGNPVETDPRNGLEVVLRYENEKDGPFLADLSHIDKWMLQESDLSRVRLLDISIPETTGHCSVGNKTLIIRQSATQALFWHLSGKHREMPRNLPWTDVTDGYALLALAGDAVPKIAETLTPLPLFRPLEHLPFCFRGPVTDIPCQVVVTKQPPDPAMLLLACARGYGQSLAEALLIAGKPWGLSPAGEQRFSELFLL
ncbi:sarcosine oxidase subunit gamma SoxG [Desulfonema ishimotonii]|uniref:Sarcosine oxidase subunit gamma SoxG n=1 Tax=Desulfonema ishimotonii TaxID=45657 RepID=A0A401FVX0_9BACT|nr:hypothetical protein [Desulfonema ishimotonii]GBC61108.1 sarcosine oxidase subunit gamma SoxG [Desulfonema ishimotonii]